METWTKYTFICDPEGCDSLAEYTVKDTYVSRENVTNVTCLCGRILDLLSVQDATILPITETKEDKMETQTPAQVMNLDWIENEQTVNRSYTESDVRAMVWNNKNLNAKQNEWYKKESQLRTLLEEVYADSSEQEVLSQIADIFDVSLTKEVEVTIYVRVDATIEVDMADGDYDLESLVADNLQVDAFGSEININNFEIEKFEEGAY